LLLLRLCLGFALVCLAMAGPSGQHTESLPFLQSQIAAAGGIFLIAGLWTPAMGALIFLDEIGLALSHSQHGQDAGVSLVLAVFALSVAMIGPGAWSIDARLFGRKRFDIDQTKRKRPSL